MYLGVYILYISSFIFLLLVSTKFDFHDLTSITNPPKKSQ